MNEHEYYGEWRYEIMTWNRTRKLIRYLSVKNKLNFMPDTSYLKLYYWARTGKKLNLKKPQTFNEKLQWIKLYDRKPEYTMMVDKYEVKKYIADTIGEKYVIPTLGVWDSFNDIDFDSLPQQFVLKCTHDSGGLVICKDKSKLDMNETKTKIENSLKRNYYKHGREWPYKNVRKRIIAEEYIKPFSGELNDYKIFCFNGKAEITLVCSERFSRGGLKEDFFDKKWNHLDMRRIAHSNSEYKISSPRKYELMLKLAETLSENIPFIRCDFYETEDKIYFGELTFFPAGGFEGFSPEIWDKKLGDWINL